MSIEFLLTTLIIVATPGTGVLYTMAAGLARGFRASIVAAVGCTLGIVPHLLAAITGLARGFRASVVAAVGGTLGIVPHLLAAITGLAAVFHTSALAFQTLKYLGVAYLLYMAWSTLRDGGALSVETDAAPRGAGRVIWSGVLINILNPKLTIFFFAFLPQFVDAGGPGSMAAMLRLSAVFMALTFVVFVGYGFFASAIRTHVIRRPQVLTWLRRVFGGAFAALAARLALTER